MIDIRAYIQKAKVAATIRLLWLCGLILLGGCAWFPLGHVGQAADSATTAVAIYGYNAVEANPALAPGMDAIGGHLALLAGKMLLGYGILFLPDEACKGTYQIYSGMGWGAAILNIAVMAGLASPPIAAVVLTVSAVSAAVLTKEAAEKWCSKS